MKSALGKLEEIPPLARCKIGEARRSIEYSITYGESAPSHYELIDVDPDDIKYCTLPSLMAQLELSRCGTHIEGGNWDRREKYEGRWYTRHFDPPVVAEFEDHVLFRSMKNHFEYGVSWEDTEWYSWVRQNPHVVGQYEDEQTADRRLHELETLYDDVAENGYQKQRQLLRRSNAAFFAKRFPSPEYHEIDVNIGRDGELYFNYNGRHRLAIAKILNVDTLPVRVFTRHAEWQRKRNEVANAGDETELSDETLDFLEHPDIKPLR